MNVNDVSGYQSQYLSADDLNGMEWTVTIAGDELATFKNDGKEQDKIVLHFQELINNRRKGFAVSKTNAQIIAQKYGNETSAWVGKPLVIFPGTIPIGGKPQDIVQIRIPAPAAPQQTAVQQGIAAQAPLPQGGPEHAPAVSDFPGDR